MQKPYKDSVFFLSFSFYLSALPCVFSVHIFHPLSLSIDLFRFVCIIITIVVVVLGTTCVFVFVFVLFSTNRMTNIVQWERVTE